jgi:hypothetical protein
MNRVTVWVSILLLLIVGIPFVVGGFWCMSESLEYDDDPDVGLVAAVFGAGALLIVAPFCIGAGCIAARHKPWRSQQSPGDKK